MGEHVVIYYNDSIDSDNLAAAMALQHATSKWPNTRNIWIIEPRQVSLVLDFAGKQWGPCIEVIERYFPGRGDSRKVLLGGLLSERDIGALEHLTDRERELLRLAVMPKHDSKEDAILHNTLTALDQAVCLAEWSEAPVEMYLDVDSLDEIDNPVNLNFHHHEELVTRSEDELKLHEAIMSQPRPERRENMRKWYRDCTERVEKQAAASQSPVRPLNFDSLCDTINKADKVSFFGGSSLRILKQFIKGGVASKINCHLQVGSCDLSVNLFPNQFNVALNTAAAKYVLQNYTEFADFAVVPSHSAQNVKYSLVGLKEQGGHCLETRLLGFNCRADPSKIASRQLTLDNDFRDKAFPMPDLTSFLCALVPEYRGATRGRVVLNDEDGTLLFQFVDSDAGIPAYDLTNKDPMSENEVKNTFKALGLVPVGNN